MFCTWREDYCKPAPDFLWALLHVPLPLVEYALYFFM